MKRYLTILASHKFNPVMQCNAREEVTTTFWRPLSVKVFHSSFEHLLYRFIPENIVYQTPFSNRWMYWFRGSALSRHKTLS